MATASPTKKLMKTPVKASAPAEAETEQEQTTASKPTGNTVTKAISKPAPKVATDKVESADAGEATVDVIAATAKQIENSTADKAFAQVRNLQGDIDQNYFRLGGFLSKIQSEGWHQDKGYENFKAWCEAEAGIAYRKAMYLITIYNGLVESGVPWEKVGHLGWTKLKELAPILSTDNVDEWVGIAENVTVLQLIEQIKQATKGIASGDTPEPEQPEITVSTKTFKLHKDQRETVDGALEKAKHEGNTEHDSVALEYICMDFLSGGKGGKKMPSLLEQMKKKSVEEVLGMLDEAFPLLVVSAALYETAEEAAAAKAELEAEQQGAEESAEAA